MDILKYRFCFCCTSLCRGRGVGRGGREAWCPGGGPAPWGHNGNLAPLTLSSLVVVSHFFLPCPPMSVLLFPSLNRLPTRVIPPELLLSGCLLLQRWSWLMQCDIALPSGSSRHRKAVFVPFDCRKNLFIIWSLAAAVINTIINDKVRRAGIMVLPRRQGGYSLITVRSISILHQSFYSLLCHNIWMISSGTLSDGAWYQSHVVCSFILSPGRELCMQHTGYVARVLLVFCLTYALLHVYVGEGHIKAGTLHLHEKVMRLLMALSSQRISTISPG